METIEMVKNKGFIFAIFTIAALLFSLFFVYAVTVPEFAFNIPLTPGNNFTGTVTLRVNLTNGAAAGQYYNITNVSFYTLIQGSTTPVLIGHNTTFNLTSYTITWNTNNGNFADNLSYSIIANASATNSTLGASVVLDSVVTNIGVDNTPEVCDDTIDNDGDGFIDCADIECADEPYCVESANCNDSVDNDVDGLIDCNDFLDCGGFCIQQLQQQVNQNTQDIGIIQQTINIIQTEIDEIKEVIERILCHIGLKICQKETQIRP